ncbi:hypothetical protein KM043_008925 [Ampulex compressa]|nr:hypothetical protein KM043_008925 [Ampulex compressa]
MSGAIRIDEETSSSSFELWFADLVLRGGRNFGLFCADGTREREAEDLERKRVLTSARGRPFSIRTLLVSSVSCERNLFYGRICGSVNALEENRRLFGSESEEAAIRRSGREQPAIYPEDREDEEDRREGFSEGLPSSMVPTIGTKRFGIEPDTILRRITFAKECPRAGRLPLLKYLDPVSLVEPEFRATQIKRPVINHDESRIAQTRAPYKELLSRSGRVPLATEDRNRGSRDRSSGISKRLLVRTEAGQGCRAWGGKVGGRGLLPAPLGKEDGESKVEKREACARTYLPRWSSRGAAARAATNTRSRVCAVAEGRADDRSKRSSRREYAIRNRPRHTATDRRRTDSSRALSSSDTDTELAPYRRELLRPRLTTRAIVSRASILPVFPALPEPRVARAPHHFPNSTDDQRDPARSPIRIPTRRMDESFFGRK